jgi:hypothetical protein
LSNPNEPSDASKPAIKDKNPHNYRKVGYSMIVISVSLVLIGLLVWAIGDNYHFSSDIMANQEIDAMTPKHGFNLVYYDTAQPVGAKLKLLDSASTIDDAQQKKIQYAQQNTSPNGMVLIFNETLAANQKLVQNTIAAITKLKADQAQALAQAQADKAQAAASVTANQTMSTPPANKNATSSNATKVAASSTPIISIPINATVTTHVSNSTIPVKPTIASESLGIGANVTITHLSNSGNATTNHTKTLPLSEKVSVQGQ